MGLQLAPLSTLNPLLEAGSNIRQTFALIRAIVLSVLVNRLVSRTKHVLIARYTCIIDRLRCLHSEDAITG